MVASARGKRIAVLGDPLLDVWIPAVAGACDEGQRVLITGPEACTPGGAANAVRQLDRWGCEARLLAPVDSAVWVGLAPSSVVLGCDENWINPIKTRYLDAQGRVILRVDREETHHGLDSSKIHELRQRAVKALREGEWDAVYVSDYNKGFLDDEMVHCIATGCRERDIPCVMDLKRSPACARGAILKCNGNYAVQHGGAFVITHSPAAVVTHGALPPMVYSEAGVCAFGDDPFSVPCVNVVGAGDCFGAHLVLGLACGVPLAEAAKIAHAAGRVYVQHLHGRPPWPHEVARNLEPVSGKVTVARDDLRQSLEGRKAVFANGVFRFPHAGHAWLLDWARHQGDVLVVGLNDDNSAGRLRLGQPYLPWAERAGVLAGLTCVDWIVPFSGDTPGGLVEQLRPAILVKGSEYAGTIPPGAEFAGEVRFAPPSPFPRHSSDIIDAIRA